jgi:hypothetical protein
VALICALIAVTSQPLAAEEPVDLSAVTSLEQAQRLADEGKLFKILLFPAEFGGEDVPPNIIYVPAGIKEAKDLITHTLVGMVEDGSIDKLVVEPEYKGSSFVPARIRMHATHSGKPGQFDPVIEIW